MTRIREAVGVDFVKNKKGRKKPIPQPESSSAPASVYFTVRVEDAGSGIKEVRPTVDGVSQDTMTGGGNDYSKTVSLSKGAHGLSVEAVDNVGNMATQSNILPITVILIWILAIVAVVVILLAVLLLGGKEQASPTTFIKIHSLLSIF